MPKKRGQVDQPAVRIDALAVPSQQCSNGKRVSKVMQSRRRYAWRQNQPEFGNESVKRLADGLRAYTAAFRKREQRPIGCVRAAMVLLYVIAEACCQPGPQRHKRSEERRVGKECRSRWS